MKNELRVNGPEIVVEGFIDSTKLRILTSYSNLVITNGLKDKTELSNSMELDIITKDGYRIIESQLLADIINEKSSDGRMEFLKNGDSYYPF